MLRRMESSRSIRPQGSIRPQASLRAQRSLRAQSTFLKRKSSLRSSQSTFLSRSMTRTRTLKGGKMEKKEYWRTQEQTLVLQDAKHGTLAPSLELHEKILKAKAKKMNSLVTRFNLSDDTPTYVNSTFQIQARDLSSAFNLPRVQMRSVQLFTESFFLA